MTDVICGLDEAGRGPIAGPVTAAAVVLPQGFPVDVLRDSKRLSPKRRRNIETIIRSGCIAFGIGWCSPREIDRINILQASLRAMERAYQAAAALLPPDYWIVHVLIDGNQFPRIDDHMYAIVKGDAMVPEIMAASILAKQARDRWMLKASQRYVHWQFEKHKGYPTAEHRRLCSEYGLSPIHRKSFRIVS
jgi:ribonuclease HII